ncbi:MAG: hypothetical protein ACOC0D_02165 [Spirochaeta sp.]
MKQRLRIPGMILICIIIGAPGVTAQQNDQRMYPVGHAIYDHLERGYRDAGRVLPELVQPMSGAQLRFYLGLLDDAVLSPAGDYALSEAWRILAGWDGPGPLLSEPEAGFSLQFDRESAWNSGFRMIIGTYRYWIPRRMSCCCRGGPPWARFSARWI